MDYREYAKQKYDKYVEMQWKVSELHEVDGEIRFNSVDPSGTKRKHSFSPVSVLVETGEFNFATPEKVVEVPVSPSPVVAVEEKPKKTRAKKNKG